MTALWTTAFLSAETLLIFPISKPGGNGETSFVPGSASPAVTIGSSLVRTAATST